MKRKLKFRAGMLAVLACSLTMISAKPVYAGHWNADLYMMSSPSSGYYWYDPDNDGVWEYHFYQKPGGFWSAGAELTAARTLLDCCEHDEEGRRTRNGVKLTANEFAIPIQDEAGNITGYRYQSCGIVFSDVENRLGEMEANILISSSALVIFYPKCSFKDGRLDQSVPGSETNILFQPLYACDENAVKDNIARYIQFAMGDSAYYHNETELKTKSNEDGSVWYCADTCIDCRTYACQDKSHKRYFRVAGVKNGYGYDLYISDYEYVLDPDYIMSNLRIEY